VIASDHGEQFGERGLWEHGNSVYLPAVHVPLVLHFPGRVPAGVRVAGSVTLRDLPATILALVGSGRERSLGGGSLAEHWTAAGGLEHGETGSVVLSELSGGQAIDERGERIGSMRSITDDSLHYVRHATGREELFRHTPDSLEAVDLARTAAGRSLLGGYRAALTRALRRDD
jgi:arylsulfatase A-like enzyme